jgi:small subunit ribosomal protein S18
MAKENVQQSEDSNNAGAGKRVFFRRRRGCPLEGVPNSEINYKNLKLILRFVSEGGRILPSRITSVSAKRQRQLKKEIKRARNLALLPFVAK